MYLVAVRPFKEIKGNMIEIINEIFFCFFLGVLIYLDEKSKWTSTITSVYNCELKFIYIDIHQIGMILIVF